MATKSISEMNSAVAVETTDLFEIAQQDQSSFSGYKSYKQSLGDIADGILRQFNQSTLQTGSKRVIGAINEVDTNNKTTNANLNKLRTVVNATLEAGETNLVITNANILTTSLIDYYPAGGVIIAPTEIIDDSENHSVTYVFPEQEEDIDFAIHIMNF